MSLIDTSRFISLILRHKPEVIGITLDAHGWARVDELIAGVSRTRPLTLEMLVEIVEKDSKRRYSFSEDRTLIRANQGHSVDVDVELEEREPPSVLYHGTAQKYTDSIEAMGLVPRSRLYVHLSSDADTAREVGARHGTPVVYTVDAAAMNDEGYRFFISENGVWLTEHVPTKFLTRIDK